MAFDAKHRVRIPINGVFGTGKTSLLYTFTEQEYEEAPFDIGRDYIPYQHVYKGETYEIHLWDTNGSEQYGRITTRSTNADGFILVCSYDHPESLTELPRLVSETRFTEEFDGASFFREAPFTVVCTKSDLIESSPDDCAFTEQDFLDFVNDEERQYPLCASNLDYSNWDTMYLAFKPLFNQAIEFHLKRYRDSKGKLDID